MSSKVVLEKRCPDTVISECRVCRRDAMKDHSSLGSPVPRLRCMSPVMADAVEKVRGVLLTRNNRINGVDFLNRTYAFEAHFESMINVAQRSPQNLFSTASAQSCQVERRDRSAAIWGIPDLLPT